MLAFAAIEFARVVMIRHSIDNAVYESTRLAIIPGGTAADARNETQGLFAVIGITDFLVEVVPPVLALETPEVTVRISVPLDSNSYFPQQFFAGRTLRRELTMRREGLSGLSGPAVLSCPPVTYPVARWSNRPGDVKLDRCSTRF